MEVTEKSTRVVKEASEKSVRIAREAVIASVRAFEGAIDTAEETTKSARRAAKASMRVFEKATGGAEKVSKEVKEEAAEVPLEIFEEVLSKPEISAKGKRKPKESKEEIQTRLDFLTRMYATNKDKHAEKEAAESDEAEQD